MPPRRHRRRRPNLDERFDLPSDTDPSEAVRRLLGVPSPVQSHEEAEDPDRDDQEADS